MAQQHVHDFPTEEPPTFPQRTSSGGMIKSTVIRAMAEIYTADKKAHAALDRLIEMARTTPSQRLRAAK